MFHFYTPWKCHKTFGFLTFSRGIEMEYELKWVNGDKPFGIWASVCKFPFYKILFLLGFLIL